MSVDPALVRERYAALVGPASEAARACGYALAVHGSLARDIDLVAVPWTDGARPPAEVAEAIRLAIEKACGYAFNVEQQHADNPEHFRKGMPGYKPHGRLVWGFHLGGGPYIDLSVMPPAAEEPAP